MRRIWKFQLIIAVLIISMFIFASTIFAQKASSSTRAGEQRKSEYGLKVNRLFIYYLNFTITNFGTDEEKSKFTEIIRRDLVSQFFYMRFLFRDSYVQIRSIQKDLISLYVKKIDDEVIISKELIDSFAPFVVHSKDSKARLYLQLAYREVNYSVQEKTMADAYNSKLYSMRLFKYVRALKRLKEAKRYAFLAKIQLSLTENERRKEKVFNYIEIYDKISKLAEQDSKNKYLLLHNDSYYKYTAEKSFFDQVWENPEMEKVDAYVEYSKKKE